MIPAYIILTIILLVVLICFGLLTVAEGDIDLSEKEDRYVFFGVGTLLLIGILVWPLTLVLAVPLAVCYGLYSLVKLAGMKRKGEF
jgi:predicted membrane protein